MYLINIPSNVLWLRNYVSYIINAMTESNTVFWYKTEKSFELLALILLPSATNKVINLKMAYDIKLTPFELSQIKKYVEMTAVWRRMWWWRQTPAWYITSLVYVNSLGMFLHFPPGGSRRLSPPNHSLLSESGNFPSLYPSNSNKMNFT